MHRLQSRPALLVLGGIILLIIVGAGTLVLGRPEPTPMPSASPSPSPSPSPTATPSPSPSPSPSPTPTPTPAPEAVCPMSGQPLSDPALANRTPIMAQIENNPIARPPSGLNLADLVIEAPVEGDTTRFMAVYMCQETVGANVGPIRSARYFNIDLFEQLRTVTFHYGGGGKVLSRFDREGVPYVNGLTAGWSFFHRAGPWAAPHNVYLNVDGARAELEGGALAPLAEVAGPGNAPFIFDAGVELPAGRSVNAIGLQTASFWRFGWQWDPGSGRWLRTDAGAPNSDRITGDRIDARTVIVQVVRQEVLRGELDPGGYPRRYQFLTGSGDGVLYINGEGHDVRWSRPSPGYLTRWTYADSGEPVVLPPGRVWWEIVPLGSAISEG